MLVSKQEWDKSQKAIFELQNCCSRLETQQSILIGMCKELLVDLSGIAQAITHKPAEEVSDLVVDEDGMYNYQKYKAKRKARLSGEGEE